MSKPFDEVPKKGDYYLLEDADLLPPPKPPPPPPKLPPIYIQPVYVPTIKPVPRKPVKQPEDLTVWERQALRNAQRQNNSQSTEPKPKKITLWEKHAARKEQQKREKELKEKENNQNQVENSDLPPPPRISLTPAFKAYKNNREIDEKRKGEEAPGAVPAEAPESPGTERQVQPTKQKTFDFQTFKFNLNFSLYEIVIGAIGGVVVGIESGYFAADRIPTPNVPLPTNSPMTGNFQAGVKHGATIWRFTKRATISGIMFSFIEQQMQEIRNRYDWKNSAYSGFICGSLFGLRGGPRGVIVGSLGFTGFATIAALCKHLLPPPK